MLKNIDNEINHLINIKEQIGMFNQFKKFNSNIVAITRYKYDEFLHQNLINEDTIYCVFDNEAAQYIDGCIA